MFEYFYNTTSPMFKVSWVYVAKWWGDKGRCPPHDPTNGIDGHDKSVVGNIGIEPWEWFSSQ